MTLSLSKFFLWFFGTIAGVLLLFFAGVGIYMIAVFKPWK